MSAFVDALRAICGPGAVLDEPSLVAPFLSDWRGVFTGNAEAVVRPSTTDDVARVVRLCDEHNVAIVPQGGNTGLSAGATPLHLHRAVVLNLSRLNRVRSLDAAGYTIAVDAGCVLAEVQTAAAAANRLFPLSLAAEGSAQIGGLISTNAGGTAVLRYGSMRALVLGLEVVLADGRVLDGMRALRKDNAGYNWFHYFIGAEGTLGTVTGAVLRLFPKPRSMRTALLGVSSCADVVRAFNALQETLGETLTAFEFFPERAIEMRLAHTPDARRPLIEHPWYVLVEAASALPALEDAFDEALAALIDGEIAGEAVVASNATQAAELWTWRESITEEERRQGKSAKHDVSVAISEVPAFIETATEAVERAHRGASVLAFGHAGDGNVHFNVLLPADGSSTAAEVNATVHAIVARYRGSITAEHGIGRYRSAELRLHRSEEELGVMRAVKHALDPRGLMNPGAIFG